MNIHPPTHFYDPQGMGMRESCIWFPTSPKRVTLGIHFGQVGNPVWCLRPIVDNQTGSVFYWRSWEVKVGPEISILVQIVACEPMCLGAELQWR